MIGRLRGQVALKALDHVMLDVGGVGYVIHCSDRTLAGLPPAGQVGQLWTEMVVREDLMQLFGFATVYEREWHRLLTSVQGVGAKASMAILGTLGPEALARAIAIGDWAAVKAAPGVGPKIAQRVVNELKDKAPAVMSTALVEPESSPENGSGNGPGAGPGTPPEDAAAALVPDDMAPASDPAPRPKNSASAQAEALSALSNLGYAPSEAAEAVARAAGEDPEAATPALIRAALRKLAPKD